MDFTKYHGIGNDFVMLADYDRVMGPAGSLVPALVSALCDRRRGVGGDGLIRLIAPHADPETAAAGAVLRMDYYNSDGAPAEMCGNGIRCLAVLALETGRIAPGEHRILTGDGVKLVRIDAARPERVTVQMGAPGLDCEDVPMAGTGPATLVGVETPGFGVVEGTGVSMGNPHFVVFAQDLGRTPDDRLVTTLGPQIERHAAFPRRTNVEFVTVLSQTAIQMRVWERGVGETLACGTGACAAAVASALLGRTGRQVEVRLPGGTLEVDWTPDGVVWMSGPAEKVFEGRLDSRWLSSAGVRPLEEVR
ncbi:MAG TPA: diaminopimelate epimerase [Actinomycetota bacterium]|nr:diaminopimelate epimerase [Actinomycetota bacterium]